MKKRLLISMGVIADYFRRKKNRIIYKTIGSLFIAVTFMQCDSNTAKSTEQQKDTIIQTASVPKSNEQVISDDILEVVKTVNPAIQQVLANKRFKDSIRASEREEFWAFVIGVPFDDMDQMAESYEKCKDIENIAVYEQNGKYSIISTGSSKEQLQDSQGTFKATLAQIGMGNVKVSLTNLMPKCGKRGQIILNPGRKFKRKYEKILCYTCD